MEIWKALGLDIYKGVAALSTQLFYLIHRHAMLNKSFQHCALHAPYYPLRTDTARINPLYNPITCPGRYPANTQCLNGAIDSAPLRVDRDPVLKCAEAEQDDNGDADGDEEGMRYVFHREIRYHRDQTAWRLLSLG